MLRDVAIAFGVALVVTWLALVVMLLVARPDAGVLREAMRLLPDTVRLFRRLARDRGLPRGVRTRIWLLLAYLASPIDLIPDFVPVIGFADDAVVVVLVLRSVVRRAGPEPIRRHWSGSDDGLASLRRLAGLDQGLGR